MSAICQDNIALRDGRTIDSRSESDLVRSFVACSLWWLPPRIEATFLCLFQGAVRFDEHKILVTEYIVDTCVLHD